MIGIGLLLDAAELTGLVIMLEEVLMMEFFIGDDLSLTILVILGVIDPGLMGVIFLTVVRDVFLTSERASLPASVRDRVGDSSGSMVMP